MFCTNCGQENDEQARLCYACGATFQKPTTELMVHQSADSSRDVAYAGFWIRFVAFLLDGLIVLIIGLYSRRRILSIVLGWLYYAGMESSPLQATPGKLLSRIAVTDLDGNRISFVKATVRHFGKTLSFLILCFGFFMVAVTEKKQGLHDKIAGCLVVKKS